MKIKIAHCADLHINSKINAKSNELKKAFSDILKVCNTEKVDILLIAGDLFEDTSVNENTVSWVQNELKNFGIKTVISAGNHDPFTTDSPFFRGQWPENVYIFKEKEITFFEFENLNTRVYGASFTNIYQKSSLLNIKEKLRSNFLNIGLMHGNITSSVHEYYNPIFLNEIEKSKLEYLALGHIHKRSEISKIGDTYYAYSGSPLSFDFSDLGEKGIYIAEISKKNCRFSFKKIGIHTYEKINIDISNILNNKSLGDFILNELKKNFGENFLNNCYQITLTGEVPEDFLVDVQNLKISLEHSVHFASIKDKTMTKIDITKLALKNDFKSIFIKKAIEKIENSKDEHERKINKMALKIGLKAFLEDVIYSDN